MCRFPLLAAPLQPVTRFLVATIAVVLFGQGMLFPALQAQQAARTSRKDSQQDNARAFASQVQPLLEKYCFTCHGPEEQTEGVRVDQATGGISVRENRVMWERVFQMLDPTCHALVEHILGGLAP